MNFDEIAQKFVTARRTGTALPDYPGVVPQHMEQSYAIQDRAIKLWGRPIVGWKIGRLKPEFQPLHGTERLAGPIFAPAFKDYQGEEVTVAVYEGGFAAVEAEYIFRIDHDADPQKTAYSEEDAIRLIDGVFAGIEMAGSPLPTINTLGPVVTASDFGNNFGLILGARLAEFDSDSTVSQLDAEHVKSFSARTEMDGTVVGEGGLFTMPGGPLKAIAWLAGHLAARGLPLTRGQLISSGATTGIHDIGAGQSSVVTFSGPHETVVLKLRTVTVNPDIAELS
ncbi:2-keto-4-pentenoate hydratase [Asticcacaulis sp. AC402]|uniref:2-keto-4-pentenoate hydratase n=1 Tax=Asticcacaulis sp. AC402 TaxID=1282361 RepID=UPI0003C3F9AB|nr:2-keto-4-pentenoate hydratase [Asticcacaulis sp. AC402]ESQ77238.1 2-keto-4-pentenoate hydratase [Asticcacaulis sp. AC402]